MSPITFKQPDGLWSRDTLQTEFDFLAAGGEMGERVRAFDWSQTPLGSVDAWSQSLRTMVSLLLANRFPLLLWWGPQYVSIYNDAYRPVLGTKHPWALGRPCSECWSEIWPVLKPLIDAPFHGGPATWVEDLELEVRRHGFAEESHFVVAYSPVPDEAAPNNIGGVLATVHEITDKVMGERQITVLRDLGARSAGAKSAEEACAIAADALARSPKDIPFAALYLIERDGRSARLAAATGMRAGETASPLTVVLDEGPGHSGPWPLAEVVRCDEMVVIEGLASRLARVPPGPWAEPPSQAVALPLRSSTAQPLGGVTYAGVSSRRRLDDRYRSFFELAAAQVAAAIANASAYEEERRRAESLAKLDRAKTAFFSNVSHEFRTPLTLLLGPVAEAAVDPALPPRTRAQLEVAHRNGLRLLKLVNTLLDFSRIEAGRAQASYEPTDLAALTRDLASNFHSAIERAGLTYDIDCPPLDEPVSVDREMWEKIVLNLLSNALKFTLKGGVIVRLRRAGANALLEVADTGVGIPPDELPRIFDRFHRVENVDARTHEGSGIGLALVSELVRLQGGAIEVASELGHGTTFSVRIPFGTAHLPAERIKAPRALASSAIHARAFVQEALRWLPETQIETSSRLRLLSEPPTPAAWDRRFATTFGARIVLADDNADMRAYVHDLLASHYSVELVADGEAALRAIRAERPQLVLTDVMMPRLDGFGLLAALRSDPQLRDLPVILLSARAGEEARIEGLDAGADDYLVKPFSARELLARVGALLELTQSRREGLERAHAADRQKDEFLAMLAHELRNPLAPIRNASELLARTLEGDSRARTAVDIIKRQITQLARLVDDLLDVSRITQGRIELQREPVDLTAVVRQAVETVEPQLRERRHRLTITTAGGEPPYVEGDFARLVQCVGNILGNAIKYTEPGGSIRVLTNAEDAIAVVEISDTGVGIGPELLPRVFDLFVQSDHTLDRAQGGLGIGLAVVKRMVTMHGGEVAAHSAGVGRGSTFEIRLPRIPRPEPAAAGLAQARMTPRRVLIVDDNTDAADSLAMLLALRGHETQVARSGEEALQRVGSFKPEVVLLDIGLPKMDGYELARRLRAVPELERLRLLALTGYGQAEDQARACAAGFDQHLVKPVDLPALERALSGM